MDASRPTAKRSGDDERSASPRASRADAQRARILAAAEACFVREGFHAASMATIASEAGMSPGLIYRYFPSKHAIIVAIISRQLETARSKIAKLRGSRIAADVAQAFTQWSRADPSAMNVPLFLSMHADATRDTEIGAALTASDRAGRAEIAAWLMRPANEGGCGLRRTVAESRALLIQCLVEGLAIRAVREPDLDVRKLKAELSRLFQQLLAP